MKRISLILILLIALAVPFTAMAQETPEVNVSDQVSLDGTVKIASVYSEVPGFIVIHQDNGEGSFGAVIGGHSVNAGWNFNIKVPIDASLATTTLYAMLHVDDNEMGVYEFGTVDGADGPVIVDGAPVAPAFNVDLIRARNQFVNEGTVTIANVTAQVDGFIVIHADMDGGFAAVIGSAPVTAGQNSDVVVEIDAASATNVLWPMLHVDTGVAGEYEFGAVEGADGPVVVNGTVAVTSIWSVPFMRIQDQIVTHGDGMDMMDMAPSVVADSVLADVNGFLVIHSEADGGPGPVAGFAPVTAGLNTNVVVELDPEVVTPRLWPMLHVDTGEAGVYEFGTVEGADGPVRVNDAVLTFGINAAPALKVSDQAVIEAMMGFGPHIYVDAALIDAPGWIALHSSVDGAPGPVIGTAPLVPGLNERVLIEVSAEDAGTQVFPMLHYDTNELGVYEFGSVDDADGPVSVAGSVVVVPIAIVEGTGDMGDMGDDMMDEDEDMMDEGDEMMAGCTVSPLNAGGVNLRASASTNSEIAGSLQSGDSAAVNGQAMGSDGFIWWNLTRGSWVRSDIVSEDGDCDGVATVAMEGMNDMSGDDMDSMEEAPAATEEAGG